MAVGHFEAARVREIDLLRRAKRLVGDWARAVRFNNLLRTDYVLAPAEVAMLEFSDDLLATDFRDREPSDVIKLTSPPPPISIRPKIICLCGSPQFTRSYKLATLLETMAGHVVLAVSTSAYGDAELFSDMSERDVCITRERLGDLNRHYVDVCDELLVLDTGGFIDDETDSLRNYAASSGKRIRYWEQH